MKMYKLIIPSGNPEISIGMKYGNITLKNGQVLPESDVILSYPHLFHLIPETETKPKVPVEIIPQTVEQILDFISEEVTTEVKRKVGRPKKTF